MDDAKYKNLTNELFEAYVEMYVRTNELRKQGKQHDEISSLLDVAYEDIRKMSVELGTRFKEVLDIVNRALNLDFATKVDYEGDILISSNSEYTEITRQYKDIIEEFFKAEFDSIKQEQYLKIFSTDVLYETDTIYTMLDMDDDSLELYIRLNKEKIWSD